MVVWEPILPTDWTPPSTAALSRVTDRRAIQFWDEPHLVARYIRDLPNQPQPDCCDRSGLLWDLAVVYPPGSLWTAAPPPAVFLNGAVFQVQSALAQAIQRSLVP